MGHCSSFAATASTPRISATNRSPCLGCVSNLGRADLPREPATTGKIATGNNEASVREAIRRRRVGVASAPNSPHLAWSPERRRSTKARTSPPAGCAPHRRGGVSDPKRGAQQGSCVDLVVRYCEHCGCKARQAPRLAWSTQRNHHRPRTCTRPVVASTRKQKVSRRKPADSSDSWLPVVSKLRTASIEIPGYLRAAA